MNRILTKERSELLQNRQLPSSLKIRNKVSKQQYKKETKKTRKSQYNKNRQNNQTQKNDKVELFFQKTNVKFVVKLNKL